MGKKNNKGKLINPKVQIPIKKFGLFR